MRQFALTLTASLETFSEWLTGYTTAAHLDFFPAESGGYTLQPARKIAEAPEAVTLIMDAFYWDGDIPRTGSVHPKPEALSFTLAVTAEQTLSLTCRYAPEFERYFNDLLIAILMRWPETQAQLAQLDLASPDDPPAATTALSWTWPTTDEDA